MRHRIVYTGEKGSVWVCHPSPVAMARLASGGEWEGHPRGFVDAQIARQIESGIPERVAVRFVRAMQEGGCTTAEALEIIRDRDCRQGWAHELIDQGELPDYWFRDAWRRGHNGGLIEISMAPARRVQLQRIADAVPGGEKAMQMPRWRERIRRARSVEELRTIWPRLRRERMNDHR